MDDDPLEQIADAVRARPPTTVTRKKALLVETEACEQCGRQMEQYEQAMVHNEQIVCWRCKENLVNAGRSIVVVKSGVWAGPLNALVILVLLFIGLIVLGGIISVVQQQPELNRARETSERVRRDAQERYYRDHPEEKQP